MSIQLTTGDVAGQTNQAAALLRAGQLEQALQALSARVRSAPGDAGERVFLFQLLSLMGQWQRAGEQLQTAQQLDAGLSLMVTTCKVLLDAEAERAQVFNGVALPHVLGTPEPWLAAMLKALQLEQQGQVAAAASLREQALEQAPAVAGQIDGLAFQWLGDADMRFGPCLEVISQTGYAWVPLSQVQQVRIDAPSDLRDMVWIPAELAWRNGSQSIVFIPSRYPGTQSVADGHLRMARATQWDSDGRGLGQRMFASDQGEHPLLETRLIEFQAPL